MPKILPPTSQPIQSVVQPVQSVPVRGGVGGIDILGNASLQRTVQIIGFKGSGKTRFWLKELERSANLIYYDLTNERPIWSSDIKQDILDEVNARICFRIIDCDVEGVAKLLERQTIVPRKLITNDNFRKWKVRPMEDKTEYEVANEALSVYLNDMKEHNKIFTKYNYARFLILENEGMFYNMCRDHYIEMVEPSNDVSDMTDLFMKTRRQQQHSGKFGVEFPQGPRETYGKGIYPLLTKFFRKLTLFTDDFGFNVYSTVLLMDKTKDYGKPTQRTEIEPMGKPDMTQQFFDYVIWAFKQIERDENDPYKTKVSYYLDTATYGKCRTAPDIIIPNTGPEDFWNFIDKVRMQEEDSWLKGEKTQNVMTGGN